MSETAGSCIPVTVRLPARKRGKAALHPADAGEVIVVQSENYRRTRLPYIGFCSAYWAAHRYPPGGAKHTAMVRCCECGEWFPEPTARFLIDKCGEEHGQDARATEWTWTPICLDCYFGSLPIAFVCRLPSAIRYDQPVREAELAAHLEGAGYTARRRFLSGTGFQPVLCEEAVDDQGITYDLVLPVEGEEEGEGVTG